MTFFFLKVRAAMWFPSKQNLELHLCSHTCWLSYFTLVCLWCGRTVACSVYGHVITKFSGMGRLPYFLSYGAPPTRALRARVELRYDFNWTTASQLTALADESEVSFHFHFRVGVTYFISLHVGKKRQVLYLSPPWLLSADAWFWQLSIHPHSDGLQSVNFFKI